MTTADSFDEAFSDIFESHVQEVYRHCYMRLLDEQLAHDITQESFIRLWTFLKSGKQVEHMRAFLYTTANNLIIDWARSQKRRPLMSLDVMAEAGRDVGSGSVEADFTDVESSEELRNVLQQLKQPYRDVIVMRYIDGLSVAEMSRITGRSTAVLSVQLYRGLAKLRALVPNPS